MDTVIEYRARADTYRPTDATEFAIAIREMRRNGLTARDIAGALRLGLGAVLQALRSEDIS